jgi:hypothetical protein
LSLSDPHWDQKRFYQQWMMKWPWQGIRGLERDSH